MNYFSQRTGESGNAMMKKTESLLMKSIPPVSGVLAGIFFQMNWLVSLTIVENYSPTMILLRLGLNACLGCLIFTMAHYMTEKVMARFNFDLPIIKRFMGIHRLSYLIFLSLILNAWGWQTKAALYWIIVLLFIIANIMGLFHAIPRRSRSEFLTSTRWLTILFFISGMAALIYQITWQRTLFVSFGINIQSVTMIVTIFMIGLGTGSLIGGFLSKRPDESLPRLFFLCEILIGIAGLVSIPLIKKMGAIVAGAPLPVVVGSLFFLLLPPTLLMGATLPILVAYLFQSYRHMGRTVGTLYFINTLGSAFACFLTVEVLFVIGGLQFTVFVAAICNLTVGILVLDYAKRRMKLMTTSHIESDQS
jgi:hypothetical protein